MGLTTMPSSSVRTFTEAADYAASIRADKDGKPVLIKEPKLLLNNDKAGKPEGIHLMIGRRPVAAFGNSVGDREMLEYTKAGSGARLAMSKVGTFTQALYDEATKNGWTVISMKTTGSACSPSTEGRLEPSGLFQ
jgi:hypothetical protein